MLNRAVLAAALGACVSCASFEYEEEVFLNVDGSGRLRVSGSRAFLQAVDDGFDGDLTAIERTFHGDGFDVETVRETSRGGRDFVHLQGSFSDWNALCESRLFSSRDCGLVQGDETTSLEVAWSASSPLPSEVLADAPVALRFHFPSAVRFHNSTTGIERGNIIRWERTAGEHLGGTAIVVEAEFDRRSVLRTTVAILGTALAIVVGVAGAALLWMYRRGRAQLQAEGSSPARH